MELEGAGKKRKERREYLKNSLGDDDIYIILPRHGFKNTTVATILLCGMGRVIIPFFFFFLL